MIYQSTDDIKLSWPGPAWVDLFKTVYLRTVTNSATLLQLPLGQTNQSINKSIGPIRPGKHLPTIMQACKLSRISVCAWLAYVETTVHIPT